MKVMGLDISSNSTGVVILSEDDHKCGTIQITSVKGIAKLKLISLAMERYLDAHRPDFAMVEGYGFGWKSSIVPVVEAGTIIRMCLLEHSIPWFTVSPLTLKKWATGSGTIDKKKQRMRESVERRWGFTNESNDIVDAYALAQMGMLGPNHFLSIKGVAKGI